MKPLLESTYAIGDRAELTRIWNEHGYWFFRNVLDRDALQRLKDKFMAELKELGAIDADAAEPIWNGKPLDAVPSTFTTLHQLHAWQTFVKEAPIKAFFEEILEDELYWLPMDYYRLVAPRPRDKVELYIGNHQDGMSNYGLEFEICWIPLTDITEPVGGIVLATGQHKRGWMEIVDGKAVFIKGGPIPDDCCARADYHLGDVLIFCKEMPHYGLGNRSDRFRISLDIRAARRSGPLPVAGKVLHIATDAVTIRNEVDDTVVTLTLDANTFLRGPGRPNPVPITLAEVATALPAGSDVLATRDGARAMILRPQMY